ncbi:prolyl oligopeptidase family serine peptidase [Streptomyces sp. NPDC006798]|uniref:S9 family peptidase n=1 Tax=Streptomyces sp. NPDC006798 TaxID=3155462 RepID=UPI0033C082EC
MTPQDRPVPAAPPITAADVASARLHFGFPAVVADGPGRGVWWQERRPREKGRTALVRRAPDTGPGDHSPAVEPLAPHWDAATRVHEYGGRSYSVLPDGSVLFVHRSDQRIHRADPDGTVRPLTPAPSPGGPGVRYADLTPGPGAEVWCVREVEGEDVSVRSLAAVPLDGTAADDPAAVRTLASGADFYACPAVSPDGGTLAYLAWDHPGMPWDGTELRLARIGPDGALTGTRVLRGGPAESVLAPVWRDDGSLYAISDASGWWNLWLLAADGSAARSLFPADEEFAEPPWQLGDRPYGVLADGRLAVLHGRGPLRLGVLDPDAGTLRDVELPYDCWSGGIAVAGTTVAGIADGPRLPRSVLAVDIASGAYRVLARQAERLPPAALLPEPSELVVRGASGAPVSAYVYAPTGPLPPPPDGAPPAAAARPPWVLWVHGGPTGFAGPGLDLGKAYFTSRGIGVVDVNYTGSSGFGRRHRDRLRGRWGAADVEDVVAVARELVGAGLADPGRIAVRGGSAGGWTVLAAITAYDVFGAGVSYFGVSSLRTLGAETHAFESRYAYELVGSYDPAEYADREPLGRADRIRCPVLLIQGLEDPVVPPAQSLRFAEALAGRGLPYAYLPFPGESHGFRDRANIAACYEAELSFYGQVFGFVPADVPRLPLVNGD